MNATSNKLKELAWLFLRLGFTAFGGPAAHIAMMRNEVVTKKQWMSDAHFLDLVGATQLIPGPNSTEMAIHIGRERAGWKGLLLAGLCFILPAVIITGIFAWLYKRYGALPEVQPYVYGIKPAIVAVVLTALYPLAKASLKSIETGIIGLSVLLLSLYGMNEILLLFGAGFFAMLLKSFRSGSQMSTFIPLPLLQVPSSSLNSHAQLFWIFLKTGALLYGSGYVLFAFLDAELVQTGMLSKRQLIDAIAVGQFTPGPVFSSVTFIGYQLQGWEGAALSTFAIFLPAFAFVAMLNPLVKRMRNAPLFAAFLDAVNIASVAIILVTGYHLAADSIQDGKAVLIALASFGICLSFPKLNSAWVILGSALAGWLLLRI